LLAKPSSWSTGYMKSPEPSPGVAKAGDGARPVFVVLVGAAPGLADAGAVGAQARTEFAGDNGVADEVKVRGRDW
jgi:hypothetical protein